LKNENSQDLSIIHYFGMFPFNVFVVVAQVAEGVIIPPYIKQESSFRLNAFSAYLVDHIVLGGQSAFDLFSCILF